MFKNNMFFIATYHIMTMFWSKRVCNQRIVSSIEDLIIDIYFFYRGAEQKVKFREYLKFKNSGVGK